MRIGMLGVNHKLADLQLRELLAKSCHKHFAECSMDFEEFSCILLSTCNRTEIYFSSQHELSDIHAYILSVLRCDIDKEFDQKLYSFFGLDCFAHLCEVTAGLDSAIFMETDIQGQVKKAYQKALENSSLTSELHFLFQKALAIAKNVRSALPNHASRLSLENAVLRSGLQFFYNDKDIKILFIGASEINCKLLAFFKGKGLHNLTLCNRTAHKAEGLARAYQMDMLPWQELYKWMSFDWIIFGTKASDYLLLPCASSNNLSQKKLILDLSVPRNVHPQLANSCITLKNIDQINCLAQNNDYLLKDSLDRAQKLISQAIERNTKRFSSKIERFPALAVNA